MIAATVEDAMADIALIFHWQPQAFEQMTFAELMTWREKARERNETETDWLFIEYAAAYCMAWNLYPFHLILVACDFRYCISLSLIHQVRSGITGFFDRSFI